MHWQEDDGMHYVMPGIPPTPEEIERMTLEYQKNIRNSPVFDAWVEEFGLEKAEELLKDFRVEIRL
jgi:NADH:ubiquinone oxidoreductase subunit B-like Fe-S oxidoreductase